MVKFKTFTIRQFIIAFGLSRELSINEICRIADCTRMYYYKLLKSGKLKDLIPAFHGLPLDKDTKEYKGLSTALMEVARLIYTIGEKQ